MKRTKYLFKWFYQKFIDEPSKQMTANYMGFDSYQDILDYEEQAQAVIDYLKPLVGANK